MRPDVQIFLSGSLTFGVPLLLAVRELIVLRRGGGSGWSPPRDDEPEPGPLSPETGTLPACLLPPYDLPPDLRERARELELV